jgi:hypothetical protein
VKRPLLRLVERPHPPRDLRVELRSKLMQRDEIISEQEGKILVSQRANNPTELRDRTTDHERILYEQTFVY